MLLLLGRTIPLSFAQSHYLLPILTVEARCSQIRVNKTQSDTQHYTQHRLRELKQPKYRNHARKEALRTATY